MDQRNNQDTGGTGDRQQPRLDKTFVEGSEQSASHSPLDRGARLDATSIGKVNPYTRVRSREITDPDMLPTGNDRIPLGSGVIVGQLGAGGMAKVYKIWNEKLEVFRAVKILLPTQQKDLKNRFETEAKITAKLHHPNIVEIYSVGDWSGLPFLEMELIDGCSIEAMIAQYGKLPHSVCSAIAIFVARALVYAHGQEFLIYGKNYHGVIHRDLKPANIMIAKNGDVKLMDFGIARPTEASLHTVEGNIVGTMQYLSPEQIDGVDIDARTDLYSFGAILYEMLTGTKTFPQDTITNLMKKKIINEYRKFSDFKFSIAPGLVKITQKCLQASKENRFTSAQTLLAELEAVHKTLTADDPTQVLRRYLHDPVIFAESSQKKGFRLPSAGFLFSKPAIPVAAGVVALLIAGIIIVPGLMRNGEPQKVAAGAEQKPVPPVNQPPAPQPPAPPPQPAQQVVDQGDLKPLSPGATAKPQVKPVEKQVRNPAVSPTPKPPVKPQQEKPALSVDRLTAKYGTTDLTEVARSALKANKPAEAAAAIESLDDKTGDPKIKNLLLLEAYVESGRAKDALFIANSQSIQDAQFDYLCGRLYKMMNKSQTALDYFESALTKPSVMRKRNEIRDDALFHTAVVRSDMYRRDASDDNKVQAQNAWNVVKRLYGSTPDHPRARQAANELAAMN